MNGTTILGVDPSLRHVGFCFIDELTASPRFHEIETGGLSVWEAGKKIRIELLDLFGKYLSYARPLVVGMERQVSNSGILFYSQMIVLEGLMGWFGVMHETSFRIAMPLPVQLKSYMIKQMGLDTKSKLTVVNGVKEKLGIDLKTRLSSHKADAYCVARLAESVYEGKWKLRLPSKETHILPEILVLGEKQ